LLNSLGGWPLLDNTWEERNFNISQIFKEHPSFIRFLYDIFVHQNSIIRVDRPTFEVKVGLAVFTLNKFSKYDYLNYLLDSAEILGVYRGKIIAEVTEVVDFLVNITDYSIRKKYKRYKSLQDLEVDFANDSLLGIFDVILNDKMKEKVTQIRVDMNYVTFLRDKLAEVSKR
jgi:hypothetical protein